MTTNEGYAYAEVVRAAPPGATVPAYLATWHRHSSLDEWRARVGRGEVHLRGTVARLDDVVRPGDRLVWHRPPWEEPDVPLDWTILHRDDDLLAVHKPAGLPTLPNGGFLRNTLLTHVRGRVASATPMHRLGRGTSGVVLFALTARARQSVAAQWRDGAVRRTYRGLAAGRLAVDACTIDTPIGRVLHPRLGRVHAACASGRSAVSHVRVLERRADTTLVEIDIDTGRPHQIRIHLAAAGHPLAGDPLYRTGGLPRDDAALPGAGGYRLHAHRLEVRHPADGRVLAIVAPLPAALCAPADRSPRWSAAAESGV